MLRFERSGGRWLRYGLPALLLGLMIAITVPVFWNHDWALLLSLCCALLSCTSFWVNPRTWTVVTPDRISVRRGFRRRDIPASDIVDIVQRTAWSPVTARLVSGETVLLPRVGPADRESVARLILGDEAG